MKLFWEQAPLVYLCETQGVSDERHPALQCALGMQGASLYGDCYPDSVQPCLATWRPHGCNPVTCVRHPGPSSGRKLHQDNTATAAGGAASGGSSPTDATAAALGPSVGRKLAQFSGVNGASYNHEGNSHSLVGGNSDSDAPANGRRLAQAVPAGLSGSDKGAPTPVSHADLLFKSMLALLMSL